MSAELHTQLQTAIALHQGGQFDQAAALYQQIIAAEPTQHQACHLLALIRYQTGDKDTACRLWQQAIAANPAEPLYRNNCGEMLRQLGKPDDAETQFTVAVALKPEFAEAHNNLGLSQLDRKDYAQARLSFETAIALKPDFCQAFNNLGTVLKSLGDGDNAFAAYLHATELDPAYALAWNNIGLCCHEMRQPEEAEACFLKALELAPRLPDAYLNLIRLLHGLGRLEEALARVAETAALEMSLEMRKKIDRHHADIARSLGHFAEARTQFRKLHALEPDSLQLLANAELIFTDQSAADYYHLASAPTLARGQAIQRVALFAPGEHYLNMLWGLKRAFERQGCCCVIGWPLLGPAALQRFLDEFSPDLVVEINRTRHQARVLPPHVKHVAWIQDGTLAFDQDLDHFGGSDRTYFMAQPEAVGYDPALLARDEHYGFLLPAADPAVYAPLPVPQYQYDFSFAGFIPPPPSQCIGKTRFMRNGEPWVLEWEALEQLLIAANVRQWSVGDCAYPMIHQQLAKHLGLSAEQFSIPDDAYPNVTLMMRLLDRRDLINQALDVSDSLLINGPEGWLRWPRFAPHHQGMLYDARALANSYRSSRLVLHNGVSALHPRTFECLSCASALLINRCYTDDKPGSIQNYLTPGEHYVEYALPTAAETLREALGNPQGMETIRRAAHAQVQAHHTWDHRVSQILAEI